MMFVDRSLLRYILEYFSKWKRLVYSVKRREDLFKDLIIVSVEVKKIPSIERLELRNAEKVIII